MDANNRRTRDIRERKTLTDKKVSLIKELHGEEPEEQSALIKRESEKINKEVNRFIEILRKTKEFDGEILKQFLETNASIIEKYSPLMYEENAKDLTNLKPEEIKEKCCPIFIPINE